MAAVGAMLVWMLGPGAAEALNWQPHLALQQPWRAVSAAWVHLSLFHLQANLVGTLLVAALGLVAGCGRRAALAWALAWPLTHAALLLQPALLRYGGLSGLLHAGVVVAAWQVLRAEHGARRLVAAAILGVLLLKLLLEAPWAGPLRHSPDWDIAIAPLAHSSGAAAGLLCALACGVGRVAGGRGAGRGG